eukprot:517880-Rhodomonas_salina.2
MQKALEEATAAVSKGKVSQTLPLCLAGPRSRDQGKRDTHMQTQTQKALGRLCTAQHREEEVTDVRGRAGGDQVLGEGGGEGRGSSGVGGGGAQGGRREHHADQGGVQGHRRPGPQGPGAALD